MSRSGYSDDCENLEMWRGAVRQATNGARGQTLLRETLAALDAMPVKELVANEFEAAGQFCTLGVVAHARGVEVKDLDPGDDYTTPGVIGKRLNIARALAAEIMYENDDGAGWRQAETPAERWTRMRKWIAKNIKTQEPS